MMTSERLLNNVIYAALIQFVFGLPIILYPNEIDMKATDAIKLMLFINVLLLGYAFGVRRKMKKEGRI